MHYENEQRSERRMADSGTSQSGQDSQRPNSAAPSESGTAPDQVNRKTDSQLCCANCSNTFWRSETPCMPFCSRRCQQIDLGMWLNESRGLPYEGEGTPMREEEADDE